VLPLEVGGREVLERRVRMQERILGEDGRPVRHGLRLRRLLRHGLDRRAGREPIGRSRREAIRIVVVVVDRGGLDAGRLRERVRLADRKANPEVSDLVVAVTHVAAAALRLRGHRRRRAGLRRDEDRDLLASPARARSRAIGGCP
jgi:hypothetical protein